MGTPRSAVTAEIAKAAAQTRPCAGCLANGHAGVSGSLTPARYEIRVEGVLDERWTAWFEGLRIRSEGTETVISGPLTDQPALYGVLVKVRDLGLCLISVRRLDPDEAGKTAPQ
jgi:hypothetical protein